MYVRGSYEKILSFLVKAILADTMIGIGAVYLSLDNRVLGLVFFAIGLFMIVVRRFNLIQEKSFDNNPKYLIEVLTTNFSVSSMWSLTSFEYLGIMILGNVVG